VTPASSTVLTCASQEEWEAWLEENGASSTGAWLCLARKSAGQVGLTYAQALDSALCFGWIDGQKRAQDALFWLQRFSPRTSRSIWSRINTEKAKKLEQAGRMRPAGMSEIARAQADGRWARAYTSPANSTVPDDLRAALDGNPAARAFFNALNQRNRYAILFRVQNVKKAETRARKIAQFVQMLAKGEKPYP